MLNIIAIEEATPKQIETMYDLITSGGQIKLKPEILLKQINACKYLGFIDSNTHLSNNEEATVFACAAIKTPQASYLKKVFDHAHASEEANNFTHEIGYCVTLPEHTGKGYCRSLIYYLLHSMRQQNIFATTQSDAMRHIFLELGFTKLGDTHITEDNHKIDLFVYKS